MPPVAHETAPRHAARWVGSQSLRCSTEARASAVAFVAMCATSRGEDLARTLIAEGWARAMDDARQRCRAEAKAAEEQGLGLWAGRGKGEANAADVAAQHSRLL